MMFKSPIDAGVPPFANPVVLITGRSRSDPLVCPLLRVETGHWTEPGIDRPVGISVVSLVFRIRKKRDNNNMAIYHNGL